MWKTDAIVVDVNKSFLGIGRAGLQPEKRLVGLLCVPTVRTNYRL